MSAKMIKSALGQLQDDPDQSGAWTDLREAVVRSREMSSGEVVDLLDAARRAHEGRREAEAVAKLLELEIEAVRGTPREAELLSELARLFDEDLLDDGRAADAYRRLSELRAEDRHVVDALERNEAKRAKWRDLAERYIEESRSGGDGSFRSSLLVSAAEVTYRYGRGADGELAPEHAERVSSLLAEAQALDPKNRRAQMLLERLLKRQHRWDDLARAIERYAAAAPKDEKIASWVRLARVQSKRLNAPERAAAAYERALELAPGHAEAVSFLAELFNASEMWDHLVALYEGQLARGALKTREDEGGALLQIAMLHWRKRGKPEAAEPFFERLRKVDAAHPGVLSFFREWCGARGDGARLATVLTEAQRAMPDGPERAALVAEIAKLAEEGANAQKAIEQWRAVLRQDPRNGEARAALKRLYRQTSSHSALVDLLRQELDRLPPDDAAGRLPILRDIAGVYREIAKSDSALVTVLTQTIQLDPEDLSAARELARVYESLQRWRDLLGAQARQAELERDPRVKVDLWRAVARRWLEQFSNVQNAVDAYEKLHAVDPEDPEANLRLRELYAKRRAYRPLYDLLAARAATLPSGAERRALWAEMAKLAAERLDLGSQAIALYKQILDEEPAAPGVLDALEKQAERDKDFATAAEALERRVAAAADDATRLVVLQKLGAVYADRLHDGPRAASAWRRVLAIQPTHAKALRVLRDSYLAAGDYDGLTDLYAQHGDWEALADVLSGAADKATDPDLKVELSFRCAGIYSQRLGAPERGARSYERVLSVRPDDERAAAALVPLYEKEDKWARLPALYEILLDRTDGVEGKLPLLEKLAEVCGQRLQDREAAFSWSRKAYELDPARDGALAAFEEAARSSGGWTGFADALSARIAAIEPAADATRQARRKKKKEKDNGEGPRRGELRTLKAKLADVLAREMGRVDEAVGTYRALVEEDEGDDAAVQTLDRMLREADRRDDLRWLFDLRIERANTALKVELLSEWALLEEEAFGAPERAAELYRRMLKLLPHHGGALRSLARLLQALGDAEGAVEVIALDRDQRQGPERAAREVALAKLFADPLRRYDDALAACQRALELEPNGAEAVAVVEQLLTVPETRARAAAILERSYGETGQAKWQAEVLEVLVATAAAHSDRLALYMRLADVHEHKLDDAGAAFDVLARATAQFPADLPLWDRLADLAAKSGRIQGLVDAMIAVVPPSGATGLPRVVELELAERVAVLYDERLGDVDRARPYLERWLAEQPDSDRAFQRLKQILTTSERWDELAALYEHVVSAAPEALRRAELLSEVALVAEEIIGDRGRAIAYYERILEIEPAHEQSVRALESLYATEARWPQLVGLLERRLADAPADDRVDLELRLGTLLSTRLGDPAGALGYLERVLRARAWSQEARELTERLLEAPELRLRAAVVLEAVYAQRDEVPELVRILEVELEFAQSGEERRDRLRRVAALRDQRLHDEPGAFETYGRLLPLEPDDAVARERMLEIARRLGLEAPAAGVLTAAAAAAGVPRPRAEILMDLARLYEKELDDTSRADAVYREVLDLAPDDASIAVPACRALEGIYAVSGANRRLAEILKLEVRLEDQPEARRELYGRLGELCESVLEDPEGAIEAWRARLDDDPSDAQALAALDRLYERTENWRALVDVLRARERLTDDEPARRELLVRVATTLAGRLSDVGEAVVAYQAVIDGFGADRPSLAALASLYETSERWPELADTLEADLALAEAADDKIRILARLGQVREQKLADVAGALEAYRQALVLEPSHAGCRAALEKLLDEPAARREAAAILRPLYESDGQSQKLLRVLDIEAEHADSVPDKLALVAQSAQVAESALQDASLAFSYAARGLKLAAAEPELPKWIERAEALATITHRHGELSDLLRSVAEEILDADLQLEVTLQIAGIARSRLGDPALARRYYVRSLELRGDDRRALVALESLYEETGDDAALLDIVKRRADAALDEDERKALLFKQARLDDEKMGDTGAAIAVYEQILDLGLDADAVAALERLYARTERWDDLVALYRRQVVAPDLTRERKATLHHALGDVLEKRMREVERAFDEFAAALAIEPLHAETVASLEALMAQREYAGRAAEMLEPVYLARLDGRRVLATLEARLGASQDPDERRHLLRRLAKMHEEQEEDYGAALETTAQLLAEDPADEGTWAELERMARVANAQPRLAEIYASELSRTAADEPATARLARRTGELFEAQGDVDRALVFYRRAYAFDPEANDGTFSAIDRLLRTAGRPRDRVQLYRDALDYLHDAQERTAAIHTIAQLEERELGDDAAAIETYRAALDIDEGDLHALDALSRLYARTERWRDLADLKRRRAEQSALPEDEARYRMDLARLLADRLGELGAAIDELQTIVELVPVGPDGGPGAEAVATLEGLLVGAEHKARVVEILRPIYERADDWQRLVALNDERLALASDDGERIAILRESATLWEERGGDLSRAFDAMRRAWNIDPEDGDAREQLERLAAATRRWDDLADAYESAIEKTDGIVKRELLAAVARLHDERRDDPRRALDAWGRLFAVDESEIDPLEQMDALATLLSDWPTLVQVLTRKADLLDDDAARATTWRRVGEAKRDMLEDAAGAIDAYERALELEPASPATVDDLIALYEAKEDATRLVDLYRRRVELCSSDEDELRFRLLGQAAQRLEHDLESPRDAIECLVQALAVRPDSAEVLSRLDALYTQQRMWPELLDNLKLEVSAARHDTVKRSLKKRIAALCAIELSDPQTALETYREVLSEGYDAEAAAAVRAIGEANEELRGDAADALEPVLRAAGQHAELADVLELRLGAQQEPAQRAQTLRALAEVAETSLGDVVRAEGALLRALDEEPHDTALHGHVQRLAEKLGADGWRRYAAALEERAGALFDASVAADLYVRLGEVSEYRLDDAARAARAYAAAAERLGDDAAVLSSLDRLYARLGDTRALADVIERRVAVESGAGAQAELFYRLAMLQIREFGDSSSGLATLRQAVDRAPEHAASREALESLLDDPALFDDAFDALEHVHRSLGRGEELAALYERRVARAESTPDRTRARLNLARVLDENTGDRARAQRALEAALAEDPGDDDVLSEIERLATAGGSWEKAAAALASALPDDGAGADLPASVRADRWLRLAQWRRDRLHDAPGAEEAYEHALAIEPENVDVLRYLEEIRRTPGRERDLVETLRQRARLEADPATKRDLLREAKTLAQGVVADRDLAEAVVQDLIADDDSDLWALEEMAKLREAAGDPRGVVQWLLRRAELVDDQEALALKHRAAAVVRTDLGDKARATALYEEILDAEPGDGTAAAALRALYGEAGRDRELVRLLGRLIDVATTEAERVGLRLELANLYADRLQAPDDAVEALRAILDEQPTHSEAVIGLSRLYEQTGRDSELADLLQTQIEAAREHGDVAHELSLLVRLGEVQERRLGDVAAAQQTYDEVLQRDPSHRGALEAVARMSEKRGDWERSSDVLGKLLASASDARGVPYALRLAESRDKSGDPEGAEGALRQGLLLEPSNAGLRAMLRVRWEKAEKWSELADLLVGDADFIAAAHADAKVAPAGLPDGAPPLPRATMPSGSFPAPVVPQPISEQVKLLRAAAEIHALRRKRPDQAIPILERAAQLVPHDRELLLALCDAYNAAQRGRDAAMVLEKVIASFGNRRTKELALYHHRLGRALAQLGDRDVALAQLDMAFKIDPGSVTVLRDLGVLAFETNDLDRAQKTFRALLLQRLDPSAGISKGEVFYYLGEISAKQGDKAKAMQMFERAIENDPALERARLKLSELKG